MSFCSLGGFILKGNGKGYIGHKSVRIYKGKIIEETGNLQSFKCSGQYLRNL